MINNLNLHRLHAVLSYDANTGFFVWAEKLNRKIKIGARAGSASHGYVAIRVDKQTYAAHRLAWFYVHGVWPENEIDHIDGNRSNNKLLNLRDVDRSGNMQNRKGPDCDSKTGFLGASPSRDRFIAQISKRKVHKYLGTFDTAQAAHAAYVAEKTKATT